MTSTQAETLWWNRVTVSFFINRGYGGTHRDIELLGTDEDIAYAGYVRVNMWNYVSGYRRDTPFRTTLTVPRYGKWE